MPLQTCAMAAKFARQNFAWFSVIANNGISLNAIWGFLKKGKGKSKTFLLPASDLTKGSDSKRSLYFSLAHWEGGQSELGTPFGLLKCRAGSFILRIKIPIGSRSLGSSMPKTESVILLLCRGFNTLSGRRIFKPGKIRQIVDYFTGTLLKFGVNICVRRRLHTLVSRISIQRR